MRDSGIPWLGVIPAHWETVALRFLVDLTSGATPDTGRSEYWDGNIPWVSPKDMKRDQIDDAQDHVSELALSQTSLRLIEPDAVLIVVRGMILAHSFPTAVTTAPVTINQDMKALRCRGSLAPFFLRDFFRAHDEHVVSLADSSAHGTRKLETEILGRMEIALPPASEQHAIAAHVSEETSRLDAVREATESTIALLKERRSAVIAAAVTGQVDVGGAT
jgi:type I restriction enzyme S subunit